MARHHGARPDLEDAVPAPARRPARHPLRHALGAVAVAATALAGCGAASTVIRTPSTTAPLTRPATTRPGTTAPGTTAPTTPAPGTTAAPAGAGPRVTVTPATGLASNQVVQVQAAGFPAGDQLVVIQCAANGAATGAGNCDLEGLQSATADAQGDVSTQLTVTKGPFGSAGVVCGGSQGCLVSVTEATPSPTHEADTPIAFK